MMKIKLCGIDLRNPIILASGISGTSKAALKIAADNGAGAVTIKSISKEPRKGHEMPIIAGFEQGLLNAVGYCNQGIDEAEKEFVDLKDLGVPVIGSVVAKDVEEFSEMVARVSKMEFAAIEIALSCPHTPGYGTLAGHSSPNAVFEITKKCKSVTDKPLFVKLSPNVPAIAEVAVNAEKAGADAITAVNSMGPGMLIDVHSGIPKLSFGFGGVTGDALRPVAVRCVYDIYSVVKIPVIGVGGVSEGNHAAEMLMAGASAVGIGTGVLTKGMGVFKQVENDLIRILKDHGKKNVKDIVGMTHKIWSGISL